MNRLSSHSWKAGYDDRQSGSEAVLSVITLYTYLCNYPWDSMLQHMCKHRKHIAEWKGVKKLICHLAHTSARTHTQRTYTEETELHNILNALLYKDTQHVYKCSYAVTGESQAWQRHTQRNKARGYLAQKGDNWVTWNKSVLHSAHIFWRLCPPPYILLFIKLEPKLHLDFREDWGRHIHSHSFPWGSVWRAVFYLAHSSWRFLFLYSISNIV